MEVVNLPVVVLKAVDEGKASRDVGDGARAGVCQGNGPHADASCGVAVNLCCTFGNGADRFLGEKSGKVLANESPGVAILAGDGGKKHRVPNCYRDDMHGDGMPATAAHVYIHALRHRSERDTYVHTSHGMATTD